MECISDVEKELIRFNTYQSEQIDNTLFLLTGINSKKDLNLKFGSILAYPNVIVDYDNFVLEHNTTISNYQEINKTLLNLEECK